MSKISLIQQTELVRSIIDSYEETRKVPKEGRKHLTNVTNRSDVFYDRDTISKDQLQIMMGAIEDYIITPQYDRSGNIFINPNGAVSRSETISSLSTGIERVDSVDDVSEENDYYNVGYNDLVDSKDSNFYNVYSRQDLSSNIRRFELAYMLFSHKGYTFKDEVNFQTDFTDLYGYEDIKRTPIVFMNNNGVGLLPRDDQSIDDYIQRTLKGNERLSVEILVLTSKLMSLVSSDIDMTCLYPLKGLSRIEFVYIMDKINKLTL